MADNKLKINPVSLYNQCLTTYVTNLNHKVVTIDRINILQLLPPNVLADIYLTMSKEINLRDILMEELSNVIAFNRILKMGPARQHMFPCLSSLMESGKPIASELSMKYLLMVRMEFSSNGEEYKKELLHRIDMGMRLGTFFSEAGWIYDSLQVLTEVKKLVEMLGEDYDSMILQLDCLQKLLHAQTNFCCFEDASNTVKKALAIMDTVSRSKIPHSLLAHMYIEISLLHFSRSEYDASYSWSIQALKKIRQNTPDKIAIDVLRQAAKSCVLKRHFKRASMLITQACRRARAYFGENHQKYADALIDFGFFLLNVDAITESVKIYKEALEVRKSIFGHKNFHVAISHEDLAYALYVQEYSSGRFLSAKSHVEMAIKIMVDLVPPHHLMLASAKRVKALILEEIALDNMQSPHTDYEGLLLQSEELHRSALQLSLEAFGERNVQTAKHYGNLGRLYQSMLRFDEAEKMHIRAIQIKTELLGAYDYEVGLSIGHLASLYNYHMQKHREAEQLYLKSVSISHRLFGETYSGLEYDYRGLCNVYEMLGETEKYFEYARILSSWKVLREDYTGRNNIFIELKEDAPMDEVTNKFFEMCTESEATIAAAS